MYVMTGHHVYDKNHLDLVHHLSLVTNNASMSNAIIALWLPNQNVLHFLGKRGFVRGPLEHKVVCKVQVCYGIAWLAIHLCVRICMFRWPLNLS